MKKVLAILMMCALIVGCTDKRMVRKWGGKGEIRLPKGERLVEVTWKQDNLWMLTEPMDSGYTPKTLKFKEDSSWGLYEGEIIIIESK